MQKGKQASIRSQMRKGILKNFKHADVGGKKGLVIAIMSSNVSNYKAEVALAACRRKTG